MIVNFVPQKLNLLTFTSLQANAQSVKYADKCDTFECSAKKNEEIELGYSGFKNNEDIEMFINNVINKHIQIFDNKELIPKGVILGKMKNCNIQASYVCGVSNDEDDDIKKLDGYLIINYNYLKQTDKFIKKNIEVLSEVGLLIDDDNGETDFALVGKLNKVKPVKKLLNRYLTDSSSLSYLEKWELDDGLSSIIHKVEYICDNNCPEELNDIIIQTPEKCIMHELAHRHHQINCKFFDKLFEPEVYNDKKLPKLLHDFVTNDHKQKIARRISVVASQSPAEFVAEVYSNAICGEMFDNNIMKMYKLYNGPELPNCSML